MNDNINSWYRLLKVTIRKEAFQKCVIVQSEAKLVFTHDGFAQVDEAYGHAGIGATSWIA